jgi:muconolactone delta-isomerase
MQFLIRFDIQQLETVSNQELIEIWDREADAALGAMDAGAVTHLWKVAGQRVVVGILELPDAESVDRALAGLPIVTEMGAGVKTEVLPIYDYRTFAEDLKETLNG